MSLENRRIFKIEDLIRAEEVKTRWSHATDKEMFDLNASGLLPGFRPTKPSIDNIWYCEEVSMISYGDSYYFGDVYFFLMADVLKCEEKYPDFTGYKPPLEAEPSEELPENDNNIGILQEGTSSSDYEKECQKLRHVIKEKDAEIEKLEGKLKRAANAEMWEQSVIAAFKAWIDILDGKRANWKQDEFRDLLKANYTNYHTIVLETAWRFLPERFKQGRGRPSKSSK